MAKKTDSATKASTTPGKPAARKPAAKPLSAAAAEAVATPTSPAPASLKDGAGGIGTAATKLRTAKKSPSKAAAKTPVRKAPKAASTISTEDISLRAYFIAEHRQRHGLHGNEHGDWVEAERQLRAELKKAEKGLAAGKPASAKKSGAR